MPNPVPSSYRLADLIPLSEARGGYRVPGEVGARLAAAFAYALAAVERAHGGLDVLPPSQFLTPAWSRLMTFLHEAGMADDIGLSLPYDGEMPIWHFAIGSPFHGHLTDGAKPDVHRYSRGHAVSYDHALAKVVGECLERTPLLYYRSTDLVRSSVRALRAKGAFELVEPERLGVFAPWQIDSRPELRFDDDTVFNWVWCTRLEDRKRALVPAQLVFWNYARDYGDPPEPMLREASTHGGGGHFTLEGAVASALCEHIERDGFFSYWLNRIAPPRVDTGTIQAPSTLGLIDHAACVGLDLELLDLTSDLGIPTYACALVRRDGASPHLSLGAGCDLDAGSAMDHAIVEAASVHHALVPNSDRFRLPTGYTPFSDPSVHTRERLAFWASPEHAEYMSFFFQGPKVRAPAFARERPGRDDRAADLTRLLTALRRAGLGAYTFEARHEVLDRLGYSVVKAIVPGLIPMYYDEVNAPLGVARLRTAPIALRSGPASSFNPWPHPFP